MRIQIITAATAAGLVFVATCAAHAKDKYNKSSTLNSNVQKKRDDAAASASQKVGRKVTTPSGPQKNNVGDDGTKLR